ncbi:hypothetical protein WJU23_01080 [Prosthecobacter sp. SYSU 5D2]|uniref:hypothetical protein n=1 Tax=Prosthecobacter sp. SYSU 5D2 TaxID=3134134 RepID=UPI0031FECB3D
MELSSRLFRSAPSVVLGVVLALSAEAAPRTFTSPDGRTLQAEIQAATADTVTLKLAAGPAMTVPVSKFSKADQAFITEWRKANPETIKYEFVPAFTKSKTDSSKAVVNNEERTTESWVCNVKLLNRSGQQLDDLKVDYEIYFSQANGPDYVTRKATGSAAVGSIKHLQEINFQTSDVKLVTYKLEGGFYYSDGSRSRRKDSIEGVVLKIKHGGKQVFEWASSGVPKDRAPATGTANR